MYRSTVFLLDEDPELSAHLRPDLLAAARRELTAELVERPRGPLEAPPDPGTTPGALGLLVLEGVVARRVAIADRRAVELVGAGDLLRPSSSAEAHSVMPMETEDRVLQPLRLAVLDRRATARIGRWPEIVAIIHDRALRRAGVAAGRLALAQVPRVDERLHVLLWHLADRWGKVTPDGVVLSLRLSHEILGALIGAQRPTVTSALRQLAARGAIARRADRTWLLVEPPDEAGGAGARGEDGAAVATGRGTPDRLIG